MLPQRSRWLLPALIVSWCLQLGAAPSLRNEPRSHVSANTFDPSAATSTIVRRDHDGRAHHRPPNGRKNETQSSHKLVASPAGLLRPDKFQFYTYDEKGDMITRQMTAQEIQGLIAAGGADHVAIDRQEPQKADDVLTGGKKVMDVVQKVQNVLKSALDKPPTLTVSIPKIPEQANVEWSNILPSILSGEADAISQTNQLSHKITTEKEAASTSKSPTKKPAMSDVQVNAYAGFTNNAQGKPQHAGHHSQQAAATEKPMIPVPVITLTEQKLSTLQSAVTESPVFQIISVIPVESVDVKGDQADPSATGTSAVNSTTTQLSVQPEGNQTERYVELTLSEVPEEGTTLPSRLTSLDIYPLSITKQTTMSDKVGQGMEASATYPTTAPGTSTYSSATRETVTLDGSGASTSATDKISSASYVLVQSENNIIHNNTEAPDDSSLASAVTKGSQANGAHNDDKVIPQIGTPATSMPVSHASSEPAKTSNETTSHAPPTLAPVTRIKTVPTLQTLISDHYPGEGGLSTVTKEPPSPVTPTYAENHHPNPPPTEIQSSPPVEPLPTQLIDSFSSVINQVSEARPPVLPLSSPSNERPEISVVNVNYDQRRNVSEANGTAVAMSEASEENAGPIVDAQTYVTVTTEIPSRDSTPGLAGYSVTPQPLTADGESSTISVSATNSRFTATAPTASTGIGATNNRVATSNLATTPAGLESTGATISGSTPPSLAQLQLEKSHLTTAALQAGQNRTEGPAAPDSTADGIAPSERISASVTPDTVETQSTIASVDTSLSSDEPTTNNYFDNLLPSLNRSDPVSAIDQVLSFAPPPSSIPPIAPIGLPNNALNSVASGLASGLIAGFATSTLEVSTEGINGDQTVKKTSDERTKPTQEESIGNVTEIYEEIVGPNLNEKERDVTQSTRVTLMDPPRDGTLIYSTLTQTKGSNDTFEPTKLSSSNERIDDSAKAPLSPSANKFTSVNDESKDSIGQSATTVGIITVNPETTTTDVGIRSPAGVDKTIPGANNSQKKTEVEVKTTDAPERTDLSPESSQLSTKIANDTRNSGYANSSAKIETLGEKESSVTKGTVTIHSVNDSTSESYGSHTYSNLTANTYVSNVTSDSAVVSNDKSATDFEFSQNHVTSIANKNKDTQNKKDNNNNDSSPSSIQEHANSSIKAATQESKNDESENKKDVPRPNNNTSNQSVAQIASAVNLSIKNDGHSSNTENKTASLKHTASSPKPDETRSQTSTPPPEPSVPVRQTSWPAGHRPSEKSDVTKTDADVNAEDKWTLISQQIPPAVSKPPKPTKPPKPLRKPVNHSQTSSLSSLSSSNSNESTNVRSPGVEAAAHQQDQQSSQSFLPLDASQGAIGLDITIRHTSADIVSFAKLCNELAFNFWMATNKGLSTARSLALSPFGMTSLLAMIFLGARGPTSDQMNEVLGLDDVATFNPHLVFQNITDAVGLARGQGIANAAFVRELFADKMKVRKLMPFYKEQAQQFYEGLVTEVNFATISDLVRRRTNLLVRKQTGGRIKDFVKTNTVPLRSPLAALSANVFQTDCNSSLTSSVGRDGELYFAVSPAVRQRKLVPVPATTWRSGVLAGYEPSIDATAVALGGSDKLVSTIFVLPGQQGHTAPGDNLDRLEQRLVRSAFRDGAWNKLLKVLIPRHGLELQVPKFSHRSVVNATAALKRMGLDELFSGNADFKGINGIGHRLHLADVLQMNLFSTCGDENILSGRHHVETYPASPLRRNVGRRMEDDNSDNIAEEDATRYRVLLQEDNGDSYADQPRMDLYEFYREERQLSGSLERPRLKLDRPFLYFVRHNPSGIILHMGRFNPRLLP